MSLSLKGLRQGVIIIIIIIIIIILFFSKGIN